MGKKETTLGNLDERGVLPVIRAIFHDEWGGVLRVRTAGRNCSLWFVKGQIAHALLTEGKQRVDGVAALEKVALWTKGTFMLDAGELPPARSIRLAMDDILSFLEHEAGAVTEAAAEPKLDHLESVLESLRERVPGLESLSVMNGALVEATTALDLKERGWLSEQLRSYCGEDSVKPEKLFLQQGDHTLLILKRGQLATVLSARTGTAPEALFWAGEEARKRVMTEETKD
ncbi:MAG TPA: DUF4388 domain-containing protein [bacterium]|jgi:hypothetical protein